MFHSIICNIIGGIIVAILVPIYSALKKYLRNWQLKKILGRDADPSSIFNIVYAKLSLGKIYDGSNKKIKYPYYKEEVEGIKINSMFSIKYPVSSCELRAVNYLSSLYKSFIKSDLSIVSDMEIFRKLDISFISLGLESNYKTIDTFKNKSNTLAYVSKDHNFRLSLIHI